MIRKNVQHFKEQLLCLPFVSNFMEIYRVSEVAAKNMNESLSVKNSPKKCYAVVEGRVGYSGGCISLRLFSPIFFFLRKVGMRYPLLETTSSG